jgi:hypothetical protein
MAFGGQVDTGMTALELSRLLQIDLIVAANEKIDLNAKKYPVDKARGSNAKYTAYLEGEK